MVESEHWISSTLLARHAERITQSPMDTAWDADSVPRVLADHISAILGDSSALETVGRLSYDHPLGYLKLILWQGPGRQRLRLHLWRPARHDVAPDIHDHYWDFRSIILIGRVAFDEYTVIEGDQFDANEMVPIGGGSFATRPLGRTGLIKTHREICCPAQTYALDASVPHATVALTEATSLVFQGAPRRPSNVIYRSRALPPVGSFDRRSLTTANVAGVLTQVLEQIRNLPVD